MTHQRRGRPFVEVDFAAWSAVAFVGLEKIVYRRPSAIEAPSGRLVGRIHSEANGPAHLFRSRRSNRSKLSQCVENYINCESWCERMT
jgi:hypothetical protein